MVDKLKANVNGFDIRKQENKILLIFIASIMVYIIFILFGDIQKITNAALRFNWKLIPLLLFLTFLNYVVRALRFNLYLRELNVHVPFKEAFSIFMAGLSMTVTPGKSGEVIKAYILKRTHGKNLSEILPVLIVERLTDGIAMILLAIGGILIANSSTIFFIFSALFIIGFFLFIKLQGLVLTILGFLEKKFPHVKMLEFFRVFFHNAKVLLTGKSLSLGIILGMIAWSFEAYSLYILVREFIQVDFVKGVLLSFFIFSFSSIAAFFVLIPGGIGVAEGSISYFLTTFFALQPADAIFITILFRFITLWFGVSLGLCFLVSQVRSRLQNVVK